jgi:chemotaxis protein methyltransferase CheR
MAVTEAPARLDQLALYVEAGTGLQFAGARRRDLHSALRRIVAFKGFGSETDCLDWFLDSGWNQEKADLCGVHLTIGETYFFREPRGFELLADYARYKLRADPDARLRLWSAGCCTGEEPYSMAMMLDQAVPGLDPARLAILGTDLNEANLAFARAGVYREWSFRRTDPALRAAHFKATGDGRLALRPEIRAQVRFAQLNLALPVYPSLATAGTDIIFCRNVLMYFSRRQAALAIARMRACLVDGGWLVVNPSEASADLFTGFTGVYHPDAIFFQKSEDPLARPRPAQPPQAGRPIAARPIAARPIAARPIAPPLSSTRPLGPRLPGARPTAAPAVRGPAARGPAAPPHLPLRAAAAADPADAVCLARALARCGDSGAALRVLVRAADSWPLAAELYQAAAEIALEQDDHATAQRYLKRQLYLQPDSILAHYLSALAYLGEGKCGPARRQFATSHALLAALGDDAIVPGSDGWQAASLRAMVGSRLGSGA